MAFEITDTSPYRMGSFDGDPEDLHIPEKIVDISDECDFLPEDRRALIMYTTVEGLGRVAQVVVPYEGEVWRGIFRTFYLDDLGRFWGHKPHMLTFFGEHKPPLIGKKKLERLIREYAPTFAVA